MGRVDFQPTYGRPDQYRAGERTLDVATRVAQAVVASPRIPFIGPGQASALRIEPLTGNGGTWWFVDAVNAGTMFGNPDPRVIPPDQQRSLIEKLRADGSLLAGGQFGRTGLTTIPREDRNLAAMYRAQLTGNGSGPKDITGYLALDHLSDVKVRSQNTDHDLPVTVVIGAALKRNTEIGEITKKIQRIGYGSRDTGKRTKTSGRRW